MESITEEEIHGIIAYGIKIRNPQYAYFFQGIEYETSSAIVNKILEEYHRQIDKFIEEEDKVLAHNLLPRKAEVSREMRIAAGLSLDEYTELMQLNHEAYNRRVLAFSDNLNLKAVAEKQMQWYKRNRDRIDHFCTDTGETRTYTAIM